MAWLWQSSQWSWRPPGPGSRWRACSIRPALPCCCNPEASPGITDGTIWLDQKLASSSFITRSTYDQIWHSVNREKSENSMTICLEPFCIFLFPSAFQSSQGRSCSHTWNDISIINFVKQSQTNILSNKKLIPWQLALDRSLFLQCSWVFNVKGDLERESFIEDSWDRGKDKPVFCLQLRCSPLGFSDQLYCKRTWNLKRGMKEKCEVWAWLNLFDINILLDFLFV